MVCPCSTTTAGRAPGHSLPGRMTCMASFASAKRRESAKPEAGLIVDRRGSSRTNGRRRGSNRCTNRRRLTGLSLIPARPSGHTKRQNDAGRDDFGVASPATLTRGLPMPRGPSSTVGDNAAPSKRLSSRTTRGPTTPASCEGATKCGGNGLRKSARCSAESGHDLATPCVGVGRQHLGVLPNCVAQVRRGGATPLGSSRPRASLRQPSNARTSSGAPTPSPAAREAGVAHPGHQCASKHR